MTKKEEIENEEKQDLIQVEGTESKVALRTQEGLVALAQSYLRKNGDVVLPPNYDVNDAIKSLYLATLQTVDKTGRPALEVCTKESIKEAVQNYVSKGLNVAKKQCYPIVRGNTLTLHESYFGRQKEAMSYAGIKINSNVIYEGESVEIDTRQDGSKIIRHKPDFTKFDASKIIGAYAVAVREDGTVDDSDIMTIKEIRRSWAQGSSGGKVHEAFPVEMCRKTVIARLAKKYVNTSDDKTKFEVLNSDMGDYYDNTDINPNVEIEDNVEIKPAFRKTTNEPEMVVGDIEGSGKTKEILYKEFITHKSQYRAVPNSYKEEQQEDGHTRKTIEVYCD